MINVRHGANGAPCREKIRQDLHHWGEALDGQLAQAGEDTELCGVDVDADREERVHEMHPSVLVDAYKGDALQARDRHLPQREMRKEEVQPLACAFLRSARRPVLADGPGMRSEVVASSAGTGPVPSASATDRGDHRRPGSTVVSGKRSGQCW